MNVTRTATARDVFHAIADPTRRRILDALAKDESSVSRLLPMFEISQPAVSQHLRVLREAGLVDERRSGRERIYRISPHRLAEVSQWIAQYERFWNTRLDRLGDYLDKNATATRRRKKSS